MTKNKMANKSISLVNTVGPSMMPATSPVTMDISPAPVITATRNLSGFMLTYRSLTRVQVTLGEAASRNTRGGDVV